MISVCSSLVFPLLPLPPLLLAQPSWDVLVIFVQSCKNLSLLAIDAFSLVVIYMLIDFIRRQNIVKFQLSLLLPC